MPMSARRHTLLAAFTAALLLTSSMTPARPAGVQIAASDGHAAEYNAFFSSKYRACDADLLSQLWGSEFAEAKVRIGSMLLAHHENDVESALAKAKARRFRCLMGFNFDDASRVAALWTTPDGH